MTGRTFRELVRAYDQELAADDDDLRAARGIMIGLGFACIPWGLLVAAIWYWWGPIVATLLRWWGMLG
jgi:hypothetical protein